MVWPRRPEPPVHSGSTKRQPARRRQGTPTARFVLVLALGLLGPALAGCLGEAPPPPDNTTAPPAASTPNLYNPLPQVTLQTTVNGALLALDVRLDGDPRTIHTHTLDWGDGTPLTRDPGRPAERYSHYFPQPDHPRDDPYSFRIVLTLISAEGYQRTTAAEAIIPPPPNRAPEARLDATLDTAAVPARITFDLGVDDPDDDLDRWRLDPGDGSAPVTDLGAPPATHVHVYRHIGTHTATFTVTDQGGLDTTATMRIDILPPQEIRVWTIDPATHELIAHDSNGTIHSRMPFLDGCSERACAPVVDATSDGDRLHLLLDGAGTGRDHILSLDGQTGERLRLATIPAHAARVHHHDGTVWTTHHDGTVTWLPVTGGRPESLPGSGRTLPLIAFGTDGDAWVVHPGTTSTATRIDPDQAAPDLLSAHIPANITHIAANQKHDRLVALAGARAYVLAPTLYGPRIENIHLLTQASVTARGIACPENSDHCHAALDGDGLRRIDLTTSAPTVEPARIDLPDDRTAHGLHTARGLLLVPTTGATRGLLLVDPQSGQTQDVGLGAGGAAPRGLTVEPNRPDLVYLLDPSEQRYHIVDTTVQRLVLSAQEKGGTLGPYLIGTSA